MTGGSIKASASGHLTLILGGMIAFVIWAVLGPVYDILGKLKF